MHLSLKEFLEMKEEDPLTEFSGLVFFGESSSDCGQSMLSNETSNSTLDYQSLINDDLQGGNSVNNIIEDLQNIYSQCVGSQVNYREKEQQFSPDSNDSFDAGFTQESTTTKTQQYFFDQNTNNLPIQTQSKFSEQPLNSIQQNSPPQCYQTNPTNLMEQWKTFDLDNNSNNTSPEMEWSPSSSNLSTCNSPQENNGGANVTRKRNNEASRRSRLIRRKKEVEILKERERLQNENEILKATLKKMKQELNVNSSY